MECPRCKKEHEGTTKYCNQCVEYQSMYRKFKKGDHLNHLVTDKRYKKDTQFLIGRIEESHSQGYKEGLLKAVEVAREYGCNCDGRDTVDNTSCGDAIAEKLEALIKEPK